MAESSALLLVDPDLRPFLASMPAIDSTIEAMQELRLMEAEATAAVTGVAPDGGITVTERRVPGGPGAPPVRVLLYTPTSREPRSPALLHIHGGGYVFGLPEMCDSRNRELAHTLGCVIVSVDYRLAPETRFPGAVEDCYAALQWLHRNAAELGVDANRIAIGGESSGGGHAASLALLARDRGEVPIVLQWLIYPMIDDRTGVRGRANPIAGNYVWTAASNRCGWEALLGVPAGSAQVPPYAAPARVEDLAGLAPAFIGTAALDLFVDENIDYARRLNAAGVPTELHVIPGAFHGFDALVPEAPISKEFAALCRSALGRTFTRARR